MCLQTFDGISKAWKEFSNPQEIDTAFSISICVLRLSGLFPYKRSNGLFKISYPYFGITLLHISAYTYVNAILLYVDVAAYTKPLIVDSTVALLNGVIVKMLGVLISLTIFAPILFGSSYVVKLLNFYASLVDELNDLKIDVRNICRRILLISGSATFYIISMCVYNLIHSIRFYEKITKQPASVKFFFVVVLSNYYKNMCLFVMSLHLFTSFLVIFLLNQFLNEIHNIQLKLC